MKRLIQWVLLPSVCFLQLCAALVAQQPEFAVATIRPSLSEVKFEHDGKTETTPGTLRMQDVSVKTCIKWAYDVQDSQISGPQWIDSNKFDITAKADNPATEARLKLMLQALLLDRFKLSFHHQSKELKAFVLTVAKGGAKVHLAANPDAKPFRQNSDNGTIAKSMSIQEFADFLSQPLQKPVIDRTGLNGKYDFVLDFTPYLPDAQRMSDTRPDATSIIMAALQGELGIKMETRKTQVDVMVLDTVEKPSAN